MTPPQTDRLPLDGVRVVDMSWVWAGPYLGSLLAMLGAEVIKVESRSRPDFFRRFVVWPLADAEPVELGPNECMMFNTVNLNKLSVALNFARPEGIDLVKRLVVASDVVIENLRAGVLKRIGLDYESLRAVNPRVILLSSSARGGVGPEAHYAGYASVHHAVGGGMYITGYPDGPPGHAVGDVDLMNATACAFAVIAALYHREETDEGQFIDFSQCEGVTALLGEVLLDYQMTGRIPGRKGNSDDFMAPHNVYPAWGVDRWLAIAVETDDEFAALARVMEMPELADDPRFAAAAARKRNEAELDAIIAEWTRLRDRDWMAEELGAVGVAAAPSRDAWDLFRDPHLRARGVFGELDHPETGPRDFVGLPWKMPDCEPPLKRPPLLGEHNDYVFGELLGLGKAEIARLKKSGVIE